MTWDPPFAFVAAILTGFVVPGLVGWLVLRLAFARQLSPVERWGLAYPLGAGLVYAASLPIVATTSPRHAGYGVLAVLLVVFSMSLRRSPRQGKERQAHAEAWGPALLLLSLIAVALAAQALSGPGSWDLATREYSPKGRHIYDRGLDEGFARETSMRPSAPLFSSLGNAWIAQSFNAWSDRPVRLVPVLLLLGAVLFVVARLARGANLGRLGIPWVVLLAAPGTAFVATEPVPGGPMAAFLLICLGLLDADPDGGESPLLLGIFLGLLGSTSWMGFYLALLLLPLGVWLKGSPAISRVLAVVTPGVLLFSADRLVVAGTGADVAPLLPHVPILRDATLLWHHLWDGSIGDRTAWPWLLPLLLIALLARPRGFFTPRAVPPLFALAATLLIAVTLVGGAPRERLESSLQLALCLAAIVTFLLTLGLTARPPAAIPGDAGRK